MCIMGKDELIQWHRTGRATTSVVFKKFKTTWEIECRKPLSMSPTRVVVFNTERVSEGIDVLGVDLMLGLSSYPSGSNMEQAFGRADRLCSRLLFRGHSTQLTRKLYLVQNRDTSDMPELNTLVAFQEWIAKTDTDRSRMLYEAFRDF
jgi:hypothetical protein